MRFSDFFTLYISRIILMGRASLVSYSRDIVTMSITRPIWSMPVASGDENARVSPRARVTALFSGHVPPGMHS